ncbi:fibronectin type III domain-containing protein [Candidatus Daviesbacteria bacterium]|nr:fibronectin type III domain-containing protein [Candidatus Daviesbacteria bacterium]
MKVMLKLPILKKFSGFFADIFKGKEDKELFAPKKRIREYKIFLIILLLILDLSLLYVLYIRPISHVYYPEDVFISNITDKQATISWTTKKGVESLVLLSKTQNFPILPIFSRQKFNDDKDKIFNDPQPYTLHHVTVSNLLPGKTYRFGMYVGVKKVRQVKFNTASESKLSEELQSQIKGLVIAPDGKIGMPGVNVYFRASTASESSSLLSTITDEYGGWVFDTANLMNKNLSDQFVLSDGMKQEVSISAGTLGKYELSTRSASLRDWPNLVLREKR